MLRKLLKYDFRANMKIFLFIWPAIIAFAILERFAITADLDGTAATMLISTTTTLFVLAVIAAGVFSLVVSIYRYYSGLLRNEGYLMFTLPVKPWQLIFSKLVTAFTTILVTLVICFFSVAFLFSGIDGLLEGIRSAWNFLDMPSGVTLVLLVAIVVASVPQLILQIYVSCAIGHLAKRRRILFAVLAYYAINVAIEVISVTTIIVFSNSQLLTGDVDTIMNTLLGFALGTQVVLCIVYFFVTERILRKRLNLE